MARFLPIHSSSGVMKWSYPHHPSVVFLFYTSSDSNTSTTVTYKATVFVQHDFKPRIFWDRGLTEVIIIFTLLLLDFSLHLVCGNDVLHDTRRHTSLLCLHILRTLTAEEQQQLLRKGHKKHKTCVQTSNLLESQPHLPLCSISTASSPRLQRRHSFKPLQFNNSCDCISHLKRTAYMLGSASWGWPFEGHDPPNELLCLPNSEFY